MYQDTSIKKLKLHNLFLEQSAINPIFSYEARVLMVIMRQSIGWTRYYDRIAESQISEWTGIDKRLISRTLKALEKKGLITVEKSGTGKTCYKRYAVTGMLPDKEYDL